MALPIPSTVTAEIARARANLCQAARTLRDNGHKDLAAKADALVAELNSHTAPPEAKSTTPAATAPRNPKPATRRPPAGTRDATATAPVVKE